MRVGSIRVSDTSSHCRQHTHRFDATGESGRTSPSHVVRACVVFGSQVPVVRCVPWLDRNVSEETTPPLGPVGLFSIVWICRAAAAAMPKRLGLRCVDRSVRQDVRQAHDAAAAQPCRPVIPRPDDGT